MGYAVALNANNACLAPGTETAARTEKGPLHAVVQGDTLSQIAVDYGVSLDDLKKLNPSLERGRSFNLIYADKDQVQLPPGAELTARGAERRRLAGQAPSVASGNQVTGQAAGVNTREGLDRSAPKSAGQTYFNPATGKLVTAGEKPIADGSITGPTGRANVFAGVHDNVSVADHTGRQIMSGATVVGAQASAGATLIDANGHIGDAQDLGVEGRLAVDASASLGAYGAAKRDADGNVVGVAGGASAFAGVMAEREVSFGLRYFGGGAKLSNGVGVGAAASGYFTNEAGRASLGAETKAGAGWAAGTGVRMWVDYGKIAEDASWVGNQVSAMGDRIASAWRAIDWAPKPSGAVSAR